MNCYDCKNFVRQEVYNQQWGMIQFWSYCKNKNTTMLMKNDICPHWEEGKPTVIYMSEKEKRSLPT